MTRVRDPITGDPLPCCWDECVSLAHDENKVVVTDPGAAKKVHYIFCTERHRDYWLHSHKSMGNLPPGSKLKVT